MLLCVMLPGGIFRMFFRCDRVWNDVCTFGLRQRDGKHLCEQPSLFVPRECGIKRVDLIEHALKHCRENLLSGQFQRIRRSRPLLLKGFEHRQYEGALCTFQRFRSGHKPAILDWKVWRGRRVYRWIIDLAEKISCARTKLARDINDGS